MNTLFIRLEGPLQSWGLRSRWTDRETALEPSKSGVVGLLACALGWGFDRDGEIRQLGFDLEFGSRVDRPGRLLRDYQTINGGAMSAEGKIKITASSGLPETVVSPRFYLADASFLAAIRGDEALIDRLSRALQDPVWPLYLGRKSCPPSLPPHAGTGQYDSILDALQQHPRSGRAELGSLRVVIDARPGEGIQRMDQIDSLRRRTYLPRYGKAGLVNPPAAEKGAA
jgi:CRISPR system Cascade subunit CasD